EADAAVGAHGQAGLEPRVVAGVDGAVEVATGRAHAGVGEGREGGDADLAVVAADLGVGDREVAERGADRVDGVAELQAGGERDAVGVRVGIAVAADGRRAHVHTDPRVGRDGQAALSHAALPAGRGEARAVVLADAPGRI